MPVAVASSPPSVAVIVPSGGTVPLAAATTEPSGRLLAVGAVTMIATQAVIGVGMSVGLMPITGMTLPFVSYGGSSLLANFIAVALLISVSRSRPYLLVTRPFEFAGERAARTHLFEHEELGSVADGMDEVGALPEAAGRSAVRGR